MTISREEAQEALGAVDEARGRMFRAVFYSRSAPGLIIWGLVWLFADVACQVSPQAGPFVWPIGVVAGSLACIVLGFGGGRSRRRSNLKPLATALAVVGFVAALMAVMWPLDPRQVHSIWGLVLALSYVIMGMWFGRRILILGFILFGLTLYGFYAVTTWYWLFMGAVVGGSLILGGLWLRKV